MMNIIAFIPARGGSKGIPKKNLTLLHGKPLIDYTIEAALNSRHIKTENIFVSSDSQEIIEHCRSKGIDVPYKRPTQYATDDAPMMDAIFHFLQWYKSTYESYPDALMLMQPTSPLRNHVHVDAAIEQFINSKTKSLVSVHELREHPYECIRHDKNGWDYVVRPPADVSRRQDYKEKFYYINGAIYLANTDFLLEHKTFILREETTFFEMERRFGVDIDEVEDLQWAEFLLSLKEERAN
jgi:CMP-N,N'-diacetyllegionaminic acid synthase